MVDIATSSINAASTVSSTLGNILDIASKAYDLSVRIHDAKEIDTVGVHIGPVYRENWDSASTWTQSVAFAFHRKNGSTLDHPFHIRITLSGSEADDHWEKCSKHLERLQSTIIARLTDTSVDKLFTPVKVVPTSAKKVTVENEETAKKKTEDEKKPSHPATHSTVGNGAASPAGLAPTLTSKVDPDDVKVSVEVESKSKAGDSSDFAAAANAVENLLRLERSFDSKRTNVLSRIALVVDTVLGSVVPMKDCPKFQNKLYYQFEHFLSDVASVKNVSNSKGKDPDGEINLQMEITIK